MSTESPPPTPQPFVYNPPPPDFQIPRNNPTVLCAWVNNVPPPKYVPPTVTPATIGSEKIELYWQRT